MTCSASCKSEVRPTLWEVVGNGLEEGGSRQPPPGTVCQSGIEFSVAGGIPEVWRGGTT